MRRANQVSAVILLGLAVFLGLEGRRLSYWGAPGIPGPGFLPFWLAVALAVGAAGILVEGRGKAGDGAMWFPSREGMGRVAALAILVGLLAFAIKPLGMLLAVGLYLLAFLKMYLPGRWPLIFFTATGTPLALYVIFERWLKIPLPRGFLGF